jgi:glutamyl-tRNA synthetase
VIRGDDHLNNTPRQILILQALGAPIPIYAHLPMILGADGKRFSKRHGAVSVMQYQEEGFLPQALINYLARLGWSHGDQEIFSLQELIELFDVKNVHKSPAAFNPEKLLWLNQHYIKTTVAEDLVPYLQQQLEHQGVADFRAVPLVDVVKAQAERAKTMREMAEKSRFFYQTVTLSEADIKKYFTADVVPAVQAFYQQLQTLSTWEKDAIHAALQQTAEKFGLKLGKIAQPIRYAVTGGTVSPPLDITLQLVGKAQTLHRINQAL